MKSEHENSRKSGATLNAEIAEIERRLERKRRVWSLRTNAVQKGMHDSLTSPLALGIAAFTGFAAHRFDLLHRPKRSSAPATQQSGTDSLIGGMVRTFTLAASLIALMPKASPCPSDEAGPVNQA